MPHIKIEVGGDPNPERKDQRESREEVMRKMETKDPEMASALARIPSKLSMLGDALNDAGYGWDVLMNVDAEKRKRITYIIEGWRGELEDWVVKNNIAEVIKIID